MKRLVLFFTPALLAAQIAPAPKYIRAFGEGVVSVRPDQAKINVSIITQARTAQEAAAENATRTAAVNQQLTAMRVSIRTVSYYVTPNYRSPGGGQPAVLVDFTANNTVEATIAQIGMVGQVIDAAIAAGATRVDSVRLTLADDEPAKAQALRMAGQKARARVEAIAAGLGLRVGQVLAVEEGFTYRPVSLDRTAAAAPTTPIEPGMLQVQGNITLEVEIGQ